MKKVIYTIIFALLAFTTFSANSYFYSDYHSESINAFINSPSRTDLDSIENKITRHCEQVYLEATRRREYTQLELKYCSDIFKIKRQQEIDYMTYMLRNRGIY
jgi:hypothetical protein